MPSRPTTTNARGAAGVLLVGLIGVASVLGSSAHGLHDPVHGLQQIDLLYLDEELPGRLDLPRAEGQPTVLVLCESCDVPDLAVHLPAGVSAEVIRSDDPALAELLLLRRADGTIGPGYVLIDADGRLRYRTFDPGLAAHGREIAILLAGLS